MSAAEQSIDERLVQAAFDRLQAAKALHDARAAKTEADEAFLRAQERHAAAVEAHCNLENELAAGITRQPRLPLARAVGA
jgi:hypothetical protein